MIIFLYLILVLAWALLIIVLKCKKARAKRLAEQEEMTQQVHVVQIGSNLYDIMSLHRDNYSGVYSCMEHGTIAQHRQRSSASVTHSNAAFVGDDGAVYPGNSLGKKARPVQPTKNSLQNVSTYTLCFQLWNRHHRTRK